MPLDVQGCTRVTLKRKSSITILPNPRGSRQPANAFRDGDRSLELSHVNEEFLVRASHQLALITSLSFVHTARRFYRSSCSMRIRDGGAFFGPQGRKTFRRNLFESRNL